MLLVGCHLQTDQIQTLGFKHLGFKSPPTAPPSIYSKSVQRASVQNSSTGGDASALRELPTKEDAGAAGIQGGPVSAMLFPLVHSQLKNKTSVQGKWESKLPVAGKGQVGRNSLV